MPAFVGTVRIDALRERGRFRGAGMGRQRLFRVGGRANLMSGHWKGVAKTVRSL